MSPGINSFATEGVGIRKHFRELAMDVMTCPIGDGASALASTVARVSDHRSLNILPRRFDQLPGLAGN